MSSVDVQGKQVPAYYFESFRTVGFPGIVEHHLTAGVGYEITPRFILNLGFMHAFEKTLTSTGTNLVGQPVQIQSRLYETSVDAGFSVRF